MAQLQNEPGTLTNELGSPALHLQTHLIILLKGLAMFQIDSWSELCIYLLTTESPNVIFLVIWWGVPNMVKLTVKVIAYHELSIKGWLVIALLS